MQTSGIDESGLRQIWVSKSGSDANSGIGAAGASLAANRGVAKLTLNAAKGLLQPGDVLVIDDGDYYETFSLSGLAGTEALPIWIVALNRGQVTISNWWQEAATGSVAWTNEGSGTYSAARTQRPYLGQHDGDFLFPYLSQADLEAASLTVNSQTVNKPDWGLAYDGSKVYVRLNGGGDPTGELVKITAATAQPIISLNACSYVIVDGLRLEGAGNTAALLVDDACSNITPRNLVVDGSRFGVRTCDGMTLSWCEYTLTGMWDWDVALRALDGQGSDGAFQLIKNYFTGAVIGGSAGDALLEGAIDSGGTEGDSDVIVEYCYAHDCFDGSRIGEHVRGKLRYSVIERALDDAVQVEGFNANHPATGCEVHDCLLLDVFVGISHQSADLSGPAYAYRNLMRIADANARSAYFIKTLNTAAAAHLYHYQNTMINETTFSLDDLGVNRWPWYGFSNSTAEEIERFDNNVYVAPGATAPNSGHLPQTRAGNAYASSITDATTFPGGSGNVRAGADLASMDLASDFSLNSGSPARSIGVALGNDTLGNPLPDSRSGAGVNDDAGAFPFGETPGANWPRARITTFNDDAPDIIVALFSTTPTTVLPSGGAFSLWERPVIMIDLDFDSGSIGIWTRPFPGSFDGRTYRPLGGITGSLTSRQSLDRQTIDASAQLVGDSPELRAIAVQEEFQLRPARIRLGNIDSGGQVFEAVTLFRGRLRDIVIVDDAGDPKVTCELDSIFAEIVTSAGLRYSDQDQQSLFPGDTFFDLVDSASVTSPQFGS